MDEARTNPPRSDEARMPPCWREVLQDALGTPWGPPARVEELLDRIERRAQP